MSVDFYKYVCKLGSVERFAVDNLKFPYSVAEHSFRVAKLSMLIVDDYNNRSKNKINSEITIRKALLHDLEEVKMGDIPSPAKNMNKKVKFYLREIGESLMESVILKSLPKKIKDYYLLLWKTDKDGESGEIIEISDKLEGLFQSIKEVNASNDELHESLESHASFFESNRGKELMIKYPMAKKIYSGMIDGLRDKDLIKVA